MEDLAIAKAQSSLQSRQNLVSLYAFDTLPCFLIFKKEFCNKQKLESYFRKAENTAKQKKEKISNIPLLRANYSEQVGV